MCKDQNCWKTDATQWHCGCRCKEYILKWGNRDFSTFNNMHRHITGSTHSTKLSDKLKLVLEKKSLHTQYSSSSHADLCYCRCVCASMLCHLWVLKVFFVQKKKERKKRSGDQVTNGLVLCQGEGHWQRSSQTVHDWMMTGSSSGSMRKTSYRVWTDFPILQCLIQH